MKESTTTTKKTTTIDPGQPERPSRVTKETTTHETTTREVHREKPRVIEEITEVEEDDE